MAAEHSAARDKDQEKNEAAAARRKAGADPAGAVPPSADPEDKAKAEAKAHKKHEPPLPIVVGDVVKLKCGGPAMIVTRATDPSSNPGTPVIATFVWHSTDGKLCQDSLPVDHLEHCEPEWSAG